MIPATEAYTAVFRHENTKTPEGRPTYSEQPVIAWDDEGNALVVDEKTGRLRAANSWANFDGVHPGQAPVVAAIPGGGWLVEYSADDGTPVASPLPAWLVRRDGSFDPIDVDRDGVSGDPTETANFLRVHHPEAEEWPPEAD